MISFNFIYDIFDILIKISNTLKDILFTDIFNLGIPFYKILGFSGVGVLIIAMIVKSLIIK